MEERIRQLLESFGEPFGIVESSSVLRGPNEEEISATIEKKQDDELVESINRQTMEEGLYILFLVLKKNLAAQNRDESFYRQISINAIQCVSSMLLVLNEVKEKSDSETQSLIQKAIEIYTSELPAM